MNRAFAEVAVRGHRLNMHYMATGRGTPLLMLHPSPLSGAFLAPAMAILGAQCLAIAPDTPGYGDSDPLPFRPDDLLPYCEALASLLDALDLPQAAVYGSATGAQIAIEFAKAFPDRVSGVILDNAASFTDADRDRIMTGYFPDITPQADGSHLARAWHVGHDLLQFFPWHQPSAAHRISPASADATQTGPVAAMDATALGYLSAGPNYDHAYRVAFENERAEQVQAIAQPTVIVRWAGSILKPYTDRFDDVTFGPQVTMAHCEADPAARWRCVAEHLAMVAPAVEPVAADALPAAAPGMTRYCGAAGAQLRLVSATAAAPNRIMLPPLGMTASTLHAHLAAQSQAVTGTIIDLPGHGGSDAAGMLSVAGLAAAIAERLDGVFSDYHVVGYGTAGLIGDALVAQGAAQSCDHQGWPARATPELQWPPALSPSPGGGHLFEAWHWLRRLWLLQDEAPPSPEWLTAALVDLLRSSAVWSALKKECCQ
jgi:pimeloyl-ACP methyl ester carboxylesterase